MTTTNFKLSESAVGAVAALTQAHNPYSAMLEIADRCNEVCVHCYQVQGQKGELSTDELRSAMDQLAEMGVVFLTFSGGEATLRSDFLELVEYARELRFAVKIYTNGLRVDDAMAARFAELAVQEVQISLYSPRAEVHDWVTGVPGSHERSLAAARRLIAQDVRVVLKSPVMRFNAEDRGRYMDLVEEVGAHYMLDTHIDPREDGTRDPELLRIDHDAELAIHADPRIYGPRKLEETMRARAADQVLCGACSGSVHMEANGEIHPCALLDVPLGNVLQEGVREAWQDNPEGDLMRSLRSGDVHGCRDCALQPYCHRCYANSLSQTGDALGPYALACEQARLQYELAHGVVPRIRTKERVVGPYIAEGEHQFRVGEDRLTDEDRERYAKHAWLQQEVPIEPPPQVTGGLVQIRRPGAKTAEPIRFFGEQKAGDSRRAAEEVQTVHPSATE